MIKKNNKKIWKYIKEMKINNINNINNINKILIIILIRFQIWFKNIQMKNKIKFKI